MQRNRFSSRLGFILVSAGCAIGVGNVWRFPYIVGEYGGAAFVLLYLLFLVVIGVPIMVMEFAVGRASQRSAALCFNDLEPKGSKWHLWRWGAMGGNYLLMMFYTTVAGWLLSYAVKMFSGELAGLDAAGVNDAFGAHLSSPTAQVGWMLVVVFLGFFVCAFGFQKSVERISKWLMVALFVLMIILGIRSITLPGGGEGLEFYLVPNFHNLMYDAEGNFILGEAIYAALGQAFFTLSLGIGAMTIFGSYLNKDRSLTGEAVNICILDTCVALLAGLIIFPACFAFGIAPDEGPRLVLVTLPNVFNQMANGQLWGGIFFVFFSFAAMTTVISVFENIIAFAVDLGWSRKKSVIVNFFAIALLSVPCALGFNLWSGFQTSVGDIQGLEDFILSSNLLPIGSLIFLLFCVSKRGWGWDNFLQEADTGKGLKFPRWAKGYFKYFLPLVIVAIFFVGYAQKFF